MSPNAGWTDIFWVYWAALWVVFNFSKIQPKGLRLNLKKHTRRYFGWGALLSILLPMGVAPGDTGRLSVLCTAQQSGSNTAFVCAPTVNTGTDTFTADVFGGLVNLSGQGNPMSPIEVSNEMVGPGGRGGALLSGGHTTLVDGTGRTTFSDMVSVNAAPYVAESASVGVFGDAAGSPINISLAAPVTGVTTGKAVFLGNADQISVDVSGHTGADGRSAGVAAAIQVLQGALGSSDSIKSLIGQMGLGQGLSVPSVTLNQLSSTAGSCEQIPGGQYSTPSFNIDGSVATVTTRKATTKLVQRNICQRQTSEEFTIQTVCVRPPEVSYRLSCDYPSIQSDAPMWRHPTSQKLVQMVCSETVPDGHWETTCANDSFAVVGSVVRPEYVSLSPNPTLVAGMERPLYHQYYDQTKSANQAPCAVDMGAAVLDQTFDATLVGQTLDLDPYHSLLGTDPYGNSVGFGTQGANTNLSPISVTTSFLQASLGPAVQNNSPYANLLPPPQPMGTDCAGRPLYKMDYLRLTGGLVERHTRSSLPGTPEERTEGATQNDITKLTYWSDWAAKGAANAAVDQSARSPYDQLSGQTALVPGNYYLIDPNAQTADQTKKQNYWAGLSALGFDSPKIENALISYKSLSATRAFLSPAVDSISSLPTSSMGNIICHLLTDTNNGSGVNPNQAFTDKLVSGDDKCDQTCQCAKLLSTWAANTNAEVTATTFRESITYTFDELRTGLLLTQQGSDGDNAGVTSYLRALSVKDQSSQAQQFSAGFEPRAVYFPGDLSVKPIVTTTYCKEIDIDSQDPTLIKSGGQTPYEFIGPEIASGASMAIYSSSFSTDPLILAQSDEPRNNRAPQATIYPWSNSFMRVKTVQLKSQNNGCVPVTINHSLTPQQLITMDKFKSLSGVLVTASGETITVYYSPVKVSHATHQIYVNESLAPGEYMPRVNVSPIWLDTDGVSRNGAVATNPPTGWAGFGIPYRTSLGDRTASSASAWEEEIPRSAVFTLGARFDLGITYYAIPQYYGGTASPAVSATAADDHSYPDNRRGFVAAGTRTLSGGATTAETDVRTSVGVSTPNVPRYIKSLMSLQLAGIDPANGDPNQLSPTLVKKTNERSFGRAWLTTRIGGGKAAGGAKRQCLTANMVDKIKYPTKLISRRAEASLGYKFKEICGVGPKESGASDMNVTYGDMEVSGCGPVAGNGDQGGFSINNYLSTRSLFFTPPYIPTTMRDPRDTGPLADGTVEEPINLAQDYNAFLAQLQTNTSLYQAGPSAGTDWSSITLPKLPQEAGDGTGLDAGWPRAYDGTLNQSRVIEHLKEIGSRSVVMPPNADWVPAPQGSSEYTLGRSFYGSHGYTFTSSIEILCWKGAGNSNANYMQFCYEPFEGDTYRANRPPFYVNGSTGADQRTGQIANSSTPLFHGVRPYEQYYAGGANWRDQKNDSCDGVDAGGAPRWKGRTFESAGQDPTMPAGVSKDTCYASYNFFAGHFMPFLRTKSFVFYGDRGTGDASSFDPSGKSARHQPQAGDGSLPGSSYQGIVANSRAVMGGDGFDPSDPSRARDGGASFNPGGMYLPPFGVSSPLYFSRFLSAYNQNCQKWTDTITPVLGSEIKLSIHAAESAVTLQPGNLSSDLSQMVGAVAQCKRVVNKKGGVLGQLLDFTLGDPIGRGIVGLGTAGIGVAAIELLGALDDAVEYICSPPVCLKGPDEHSWEGAFHVFHGSGAAFPDNPDQHVFNLDGSIKSQNLYVPMPADESPVRGVWDRTVYQGSEKALTWVGTSGYIFDQCDDTLASDDPATVLTPVAASSRSLASYAANTYAVQHAALMSGSIDPMSQDQNQKDVLLYLPTGLAIADDGGLYFGPLVGPQLRPAFQVNPKASGNNGDPVLPLYSTRFANALALNATSGDIRGARSGAHVPVYPAGSFLDQLLSSPYAASFTRYPSANSTGAHQMARLDGAGSKLPARSTTIGRLLIDAASDLATYDGGHTPVFDYEPAIALVPEVLAAFFLHSDVGMLGLVDGSSVDPYAAPSSGLVQPLYFDELFSSLLSPATVGAFKDFHIQRNRFTATPNLYLQPMIFGHTKERNDNISFSWTFDNASLHMTVISTNVLTAGTQYQNLNVTGGQNDNVNGFSSGVGVAYGGSDTNGSTVFGQMPDVLSGPAGDSNCSGNNAAATPCVRSQGLGADILRTQKLNILQLNDQSAAGSGVTYFVRYGDKASGPRPFMWAENFCGQQHRDQTIPGAYYFLNQGSNQQTAIQPYHQLCVASAIRAQVPQSGSSTVTTASGGVASTGNFDIITTGGDGNTGDPQNIYWDFAKISVKATTRGPTSTVASAAPSCPFGGVVKTQEFVFTGGSNPRTFTAQAGWQGADLTGQQLDSFGNIVPACPVSPTSHLRLTQVGASYASLYQQTTLCYDEATGNSTPDARSAAQMGLPTCPAPVTDLGGHYRPTVLQGVSGLWHVSAANSTTVASYIPPSGALSQYSVLAGVQAVAIHQITDINPSATIQVTDASTTGSTQDDTGTAPKWWVRTSSNAPYPTCPAIHYSLDTGYDSALSGADPLDPAVSGTMVANGSFMEIDQRYGVLDPYNILTTPKQVLITQLAPGGPAATIAASGDLCSWTSGPGKPGGPATALPVLHEGSQPQTAAQAPQGYSDFTYVLGYDWVAGATSALTTEQPTPWSSEVPSNTTGQAPDCSIYNNPNGIGAETIYPLTSAALGASNTLTLGQTTGAATFSLNPSGAPDSTLNTPSGQLVTGGFWSPIGLEQKNLTVATSTYPVTCTIYADPSKGQDSCNANVPITYETVNGYQLSIKAEDGEAGGGSGTALVLTTFKPSTLQLTNQPGKGGLAGGTNLEGGNISKNMTCYQTNGTTPDQVLNPFVKIYRFNSTVVSVAPASPGNNGQQNATQSFFGWGVMPDALNWLSGQVTSGAKPAQ